MNTVQKGQAARRREAVRSSIIGFSLDWARHRGPPRSGYKTGAWAKHGARPLCRQYQNS
jgi:hypothetical protein